MEIVLEIFKACAEIVKESAVYLLLGFTVAGILRIYVPPDSVAHYFHRGRFRSVLYAGLLGIPVPLCSCGVVPAVAGLRKQGANKGACLAFLISAPETGVDSLALSYSLLGPLITVLRPVTACLSALTAGLLENYTGTGYEETQATEPDRTCMVDACCDGRNCDPVDHARHHTALEKLRAGMRFSFDELMDDLAVWFVIGVFLAGIITALVPETLFTRTLGSGLGAYLVMLAVSLPMYVCASASTPIAAALVLKGISPGAALVFLLAGPATNVATITMVGGMLGRRTLAIYLGSIVCCALGMAFLTDAIYSALGASAVAHGVVGAGQFLPEWVEWGGAAVLMVLIARSLWRRGRKRFLSGPGSQGESEETQCTGKGCCRDDHSGCD